MNDWQSKNCFGEDLDRHTNWTDKRTIFMIFLRCWIHKKDSQDVFGRNFNGEIKNIWIAFFFGAIEVTNIWNYREFRSFSYGVSFKKKSIPQNIVKYEKKLVNKLEKCKIGIYSIIVKR